MTARIAAGIIFFCVAMAAAMTGNLFYYKMITEINRERKDGDLVSHFGPSWRVPSIFAQYRHFCPSGKLLTYMKISAAFGFICLIAAVVCAGV
jgi:hypothetical protein